MEIQRQQLNNLVAYKRFDLFRGHINDTAGYDADEAIHFIDKDKELHVPELYMNIEQLTHALGRYGLKIVKKNNFNFK